MNLYQLQHIQMIVQTHLRHRQNEFQLVKNHPESSHHFVLVREIERTQESLRAVDNAISEYRQKQA